jgi:hypothetical protein
MGTRRARLIAQRETRSMKANPVQRLVRSKRPTDSRSGMRSSGGPCPAMASKPRLIRTDVDAERDRFSPIPPEF